MEKGLLKNVTLSYGDHTILKDINGAIPDGARIAIVGANGAGKTTLLSLLAGTIMPTSGSIQWISRTPSIVCFTQEAEKEGIIDWEQTAALRSKWNVPEAVTYELASGGERMKMRLASAFAKRSEILLLDEPTNHLDEQSLAILVSQVQQSKQTIVFVSHDRYFIDQVADFVWEVEHGKVTVYEGNYTAYRRKKEQHRTIQQKHYEEQERHVSQVEEQIKALEQWSSKAHATSTKKGGMKEYYRKKAKKRDVQIRSMKKRLEAELQKNRVDKPEEELTVSFDVHDLRNKGRRVIELKNVSKAYGKNQLFENVSLTVQSREKLALIGRNGAGKSTLFRILLGIEGCAGRAWLTEGMKIGYLSQTVLDLPDDITMAEYFHVETFKEQGTIRTQLSNLGFTAAHWTLPLNSLSQGERVKVKLMQFIHEGIDVLLLDEPTNHLDLPTREQFEKTLSTFQGTLLFASHDRYFTEKLATGLLVFEDESIKKLPISLEQWEETTKLESPKKSEEEKLRIETELQAVLGELSMLPAGHEKYDELDKQFHHLSKQLRKLK